MAADREFDRAYYGQILREKGMKVTRQRLLVLEAVASRPEEHLTAEDIYELVKAGYPEIGLATVYRTIQMQFIQHLYGSINSSQPDFGLATVYRTIQMLDELHLVHRVNFDDGFVRYEMGTVPECGSRHHHHHLICVKCGRVISFQDDLLEELEERITRTTGFAVVDHEVKFYGYCVECGGNLIEEKRE